MNIKEAKDEIIHTVRAYTAKDELGNYEISMTHQRPVLLIGPPGIGKTAIMEQVARECGIGLVAYTITHHTRQSAIAALRSKAAIDKVVELEGLKAEPSEIAQAVEIICRRNNMTLEQLEPYRDEEFEKVVSHSVLTGKVLHLIRENAVLTEV